MLEEFFIEDFENQEFLFCGVNWWPVIKVQTVYQLNLKNANIFKSINDGKCYNEIKVKITLKDCLRYYSQYLKESKSVKNIVVTDFSHRYSSDLGENITMNPYTDPFLYYFEKLKIDYTVFDYKKEEFLLGYDLRILRKIYLKLVKRKFNRDSQIQLQLLQFCNVLSEHYGGNFKLYNHLVQNIIINQAEYLMYSFILKRISVKNILFYCYYNNNIQSIIRAANQLNIETVEYQHSQVTSNHFAYSNWNIAQRSNKNFFPSKVWTWRQSDADYLAKQFQDVKNIHYVVGGNLSLSLAKTFKKEKNDLKIRVLVTLQGLGLPDYIINCLNKYPNLIFYLRLHPRYFQDKEICNELKKKFKDQIEIEDANSLTLYELFSFADYHLTHCSGAAIEAEYFDVPNIIYGDRGYVCYENEIKAKKYFFVESQDDLDVIFEQKLKPKLGLREEKEDVYKLIKENFD